MSLGDLTRLIKRYKGLYIVLAALIVAVGLGVSYKKSHSLKPDDNSVSVAAVISFHDDSKYATKETDFNVAGMITQYVYDNMSSDYEAAKLTSWFKDNAASASIDKPVKVSNTLIRVNVTASNQQDLTSAVKEVSQQLQSFTSSKGGVATITDEPVDGFGSVPGVSMKKQALKILGVALIVPLVIIALLNSLRRRYMSSEQLEHDTSLPVLIEFTDEQGICDSEFDFALWSELGHHPKSLLVSSVLPEDAVCDIACSVAQYYGENQKRIALVLDSTSYKNCTCSCDNVSLFELNPSDVVGDCSNLFLGSVLDQSQYDMVVVAGASLDSHPYVYKIAQSVEATVLVGRASCMPKSTLLKAIKRLKKVGARPLGYVLFR